MPKRMTPWVPNQHGAWPMLLVPLIIGLFWCLKIWDSVGAADRGDGLAGSAGMTVTLVAVTVAWVVGYLAFFAGGILLRARNATMRRPARTPVLIYGTVAAVAVVVALVIQPHLLWWAFVFVPLIGIAVYETRRGTPRSLASGAATTAASAFIVPVVATIGLGASTPVSGGVTWTSNLFNPDVVEALPAAVWVTFAWLLLYTAGTVPYVKTMIREKGSPSWLIASQLFHLVALLVVVATVAVRYVHWLPWLIAVVVFVVALWRSRAVPASLASGTPWPPKKVGMREIPLHVGVTLACIAAALFYDGPLVLFI